jgi:hypothetical protein
MEFDMVRREYSRINATRGRTDGKRPTSNVLCEKRPKEGSTARRGGHFFAPLRLSTAGRSLREEKKNMARKDAKPQRVFSLPIA